MRCQLGKKFEWQFPIFALPMHGTLLQDFRGKQLIDTKQLELDGTATDLCRTVNKLQTALQITMMITGDLGDKLRHPHAPPRPE